MSRYISMNAIKWATGLLKDSCDRLFVDFLIMKREGLTPANPVTITTGSTGTSARKLMGVLKADGTPAIDAKHTFFNPFVWQWRHEGYPRSGIYTTLERSNTFAPILMSSLRLMG